MLIFQENHETHSLVAKLLTSSMVSENKICEKISLGSWFLRINFHMNLQGFLMK